MIDDNSDIRVIITDLHLPEGPGEYPSGESGLAFLEAIRSKRPGLPLIVLTAFLEPFAEQLLRFGASTVISKGRANSVQELLSYISKVVVESESRTRKEREESATLASVRKALVEEIEKYSSARERLIYIDQDREYELMKPLIGYRQEIQGQLARFSFPQNVFLMMKFRDSNRDLSNYIIENLSKHGMRGIRADDDEWNITGTVYNPIAVLYCCKYGIALFDEPEEYQAYSPNVAYELGMMHYQNKHCLILRHSSLPTVPFDLIKDLYVTYERDLQVKQIINSWINQIVKSEAT